jgi:hypothetical protein
LKVAFDLIGDAVVEATDTTELKAMPADTALQIAFLSQNDLRGWFVKIDSANSEATTDYFDCAQAGKQWARYETFSFAATIDTTEIDSTFDNWIWKSFGGYHFPQWSNMVPWNLNDFRTAQDSVTICYDVEASSYWPYMQIERDSDASDSQYVFPHFSFVAPRDVNDITDTLFALRYKTTSADTLNVGIKLLVYEGTTARYTATDIVASTSWDTLVVLKTDGTMTSIVSGDEFYLIPYCKVDGDSLWIGRIEERWY